MAAGRRTGRDERRRRLGQNFLRPRLADEIVAAAGLRAGELVVEIGAGNGALTLALARRGVRVIALEIDPVWAARLREELHRRSIGSIQVLQIDATRMRFPSLPFRVFGSVPFGATTSILRHLFDDPRGALQRADLIVQWDVARKRAEVPPKTLLSTTWAPWWEFALGRRIPAAEFRPAPAVDGGLLVVTRREPPLLPLDLAPAYAGFIEGEWSNLHTARPAQASSAPPSPRPTRANNRR